VGELLTKYMYINSEKFTGPRYMPHSNFCDVMVTHESCDVDFENLNQIVNSLIDENIELAMLVSQVRRFYSYGSDVTTINFEHVENCLIKHLLKHLDFGILNTTERQAIEEIKSFLAFFTQESVIIENHRVCVPGMVDMFIDPVSNTIQKVA
jgi:hypothetical protein